MKREAESPENRPTRGRILVVDDNRDNAEIISTRLRFRGYDVELAGTGEGALGAIRSGHPDLVLLDVMLPDIDGFETLRILRTQAGMANVFAIAVTGYGSQDDKRRTLEAGFDGHLTKPAELDALLALLNEAGAGSKIPGES